jgi:methylene-tetrahydromethanopterin dehydrogenase
MISPLKQVSPFDANMALDAGFDHVIPYSHVEASEVRALVQDAMFSRPPKLARRTGLFIAGKNAVLALAMLETAKETMFPPFQMSAFADPAGSFTTAAAMVACVERVLREKKQRALDRLHVAIFGGTGIVGFAAAVICAKQGAKVMLVGYDGPERIARVAKEIGKRFELDVGSADGSSEQKKTEILGDIEAAFCTAKAGLQILSRQQVDAAPKLLIVADVNAVPPTGIEGLDMKSNGEIVGSKGTLGIGPLAIGDVKYKTEFGLFRAMIEAEKAVAFDFRHAFDLARKIVGGHG